MTEITDLAAVASLRSEVCPACGGAKRPRMSLCGNCYYALPHTMRRNLYQPVGRGYAQAVGAALRYLAEDQAMKMPPPPASPPAPPAATAVQGQEQARQGRLFDEFRI